jgi:hypothetical protein
MYKRINNIVLFIAITMLSIVMVKITINTSDIESIIRGTVFSICLYIGIYMYIYYGEVQIYLLEKLQLPYKRVYFWYMVITHVFGYTLLITGIMSLMGNYEDIMSICIIIYIFMFLNILHRGNILYRSFLTNYPMDMYGNPMDTNKSYFYIGTNGKIINIGRNWWRSNNQTLFYRPRNNESPVEIYMWRVFPKERT